MISLGARGQAIAAAHAARAFDQARSAQLADELFEVGQRQVFVARDLGDGQRVAVAIGPSQLGHRAEAIVHAGRDFHAGQANSYLFTRNYALL